MSHKNDEKKNNGGKTIQVVQKHYKCIGLQNFISLIEKELDLHCVDNVLFNMNSRKNKLKSQTVISDNYDLLDFVVVTIENYRSINLLPAPLPLLTLYLFPTFLSILPLLFLLLYSRWNNS